MEEEELCYSPYIHRYGNSKRDLPMTMFENWPYALIGISWYQDLPFVKINDLGDSIVL